MNRISGLGSRPGWFDVHFDLRSKVFRLRTQDSCFRRNDKKEVSEPQGDPSLRSGRDIDFLLFPAVKEHRQQFSLNLRICIFWEFIWIL
jgi:hypothetical protein